MIKLVAALAEARNGVDWNIAFGEAVPRLVQIRNVILGGLVLACVILTVSYIKLHEHVVDIEQRQLDGAAARSELLSIQRQNHEMLKILLGQHWARPQG